jgi:hypothetical protein
MSVLTTPRLPSQREVVAGTPFTMNVPAGWVAATRFDGFSGPDEHGMIDFTAMPVSADAAASYLNPESLRERGMRLLESERVRVSEAEVELGLVSKQLGGVEYEEWVLIFPAGAMSFLCSGAYFRAESARWRVPLKVSLLSLVYDPTKRHPRSPLFHIDVPSLKLARNQGRAEIYTVDGQSFQKSAAAPLLVVAPSVVPVVVADQPAFAEQALERIEGATLVQVVERNPREVDGLSGFEHVALGTDRDGTPLSIYQLILFEGDYYFLIQGSVGRKEAPRYLPLFEQAARSFKLAPANR